MCSNKFQNSFRIIIPVVIAVLVIIITEG